MSAKRDASAAWRFFTGALAEHPRSVGVSTDLQPLYPRVIDELVPRACHVVEPYTNNPIEADHGRLKSRLRPMRGLKRTRSATVVTAGHAFVQNLRRGHYELAADVPARHRVAAAFYELTIVI